MEVVGGIQLPKKISCQTNKKHQHRGFGVASHGGRVGHCCGMGASPGEGRTNTVRGAACGVAAGHWHSGESADDGSLAKHTAGLDGGNRLQDKKQRSSSTIPNKILPPPKINHPLQIMSTWRVRILRSNRVLPLLSEKNMTLNREEKRTPLGGPDFSDQ